MCPPQGPDSLILFDVECVCVCVLVCLCLCGLSSERVSTAYTRFSASILTPSYLYLSRRDR